MKTFLLILCSPIIFFAQSSSECLDCHSDKDLTITRNNIEVSLFVDQELYSGSIHADIECIDCHVDFDPEELPHKSGTNISKVECSDCHDTDDFTESIHGIKNVQCYECHSKHDIQQAANSKRKRS